MGDLGIGWAIAAGSVAFVAASVAACAWLGGVLGARRGRTTEARALGAVVGLVLGATIVGLRLFDTPLIELVLPSGYERTWVVLVSDPRVDRELDLSLVLPSATLHVPRSGVLRFHDLDALADGVLVARLADGRPVDDVLFMPAPQAIGRGRLLALGWRAPDGGYAAFPSTDREWVDTIRALEAPR